jgi:hypothetical protein
MAYSVKSYRKWQKEHPNFMTPYVIKTERKGDYIIEVSEGTGMNREPFYGVSIIKQDGEKFNTQNHPYSEKSKSFYSKTEALSYAQKVKGEIK